MIRNRSQQVCDRQSVRLQIELQLLDIWIPWSYSMLYSSVVPAHSHALSCSAVNLTVVKTRLSSVSLLTKWSEARSFGSHLCTIWKLENPQFGRSYQKPYRYTVELCSFLCPMDGFWPGWLEESAPWCGASCLPGMHCCFMLLLFFLCKASF